MLLLKNYMEILVDNSIDSVIGNYEDCCKCEVCKMDMKAIALNNLTPLYYITTQGEAYNKVKALEAQFKTTIVKEIVKAIEKVKTSPRAEHLEYRTVR